MRSLLALLALLSLAPSVAAAQDTEREEDELPAVTDEAEADEAAEPTEPSGEGEVTIDDAAREAEEARVAAERYEPDQRGYEPDQRGGHEESDTEEDGESAPAPQSDEVRLTGSLGSLESFSSGFSLGFDFELFGGLAVSAVDGVAHDNLLRDDQRGGVGGTFGLSAGLRVGPVSVGPRVTYSADESFALATLGVDIRAWLLSGAWTPTVRASLSYALLFDEADPLPSQAGAAGVHAELGVGVRWMFDAPFTLSAELAGGYLHLERGAVAECEGMCTGGGLDLARPGQSDGLTLRLTVSAGMRF